MVEETEDEAAARGAAPGGAAIDQGQQAGQADEQGGRQRERRQGERAHRTQKSGGQVGPPAAQVA